MKRLFLFLFAAILGITQAWGAYYTCTYSCTNGSIAGYYGSSNSSQTNSFTSGGTYIFSSTSIKYVKISVTPSSGSVFEKWTVTGIQSTDYTQTTSGTTTTIVFKMPNANVVISATCQSGGEGGNTWPTTTPAGTGTIYQDGSQNGKNVCCVPYAVDLGLSVLWADRNVGATSVGDYGNLYAQANCSTAVATICGSNWRMPTSTEYNSMYDNSTQTTGTNVNACYIQTSTKAGYTDNKIYLPKAGYKNGSHSYDEGKYGYYWVSNSGYGAKSGGKTQSGCTTTYLYSVRPVYQGTIYTITIVSGDTKNYYKCAKGQQLTITPSTISGGSFSKWMKGSTLVTEGIDATTKALTITATADATYTAVFVAPGYAVTIENDGNGTATADGQTSLSNVTSISNLVATPSPGYHFDYWTLNETKQDSWTQNQTNVTISAASTIKAFFAINQYTISASVDGSCADMGSVTGGGTYSHGETVTLTATNNEGYHFEKWSDGTNDITDNPYEFKASGNKTFTAFFASNATTYNITATKNIDVAGTATVENGTGVAAGTIATLTATANSGYRFVKWTSNAVDYTANPLNVEVSTNAEYQAVFEALALREDAIYQDLARNGHDNDFTFGNTNYYTLTIIGNGKNTYKCLPGQQVKIMVKHEKDWDFSKWNDDNTQSTRTFTVTADATYRVIFVESKGTAASAEESPVLPTHRTIYQNNSDNGDVYSYAEAISVSGAVDMGLSVLWATTNVTSASTYYTWGGTSPVTSSPSTNAHATSSANKVLSASEDIAAITLQGAWRMPTKAEFEELIANSTWTSVSGGYKATSKTNGNTLTFQSNGYAGGNVNIYGTQAWYWTSTGKDNSYAYVAKARSATDVSVGYEYPYHGANVRAVYPAPARFTLTVKSKNGGDVGNNVNKYTFDNDHNTVTIYAQPKADGSRFARWSDGNTENPRTFTVTANAEITAEFIPYTGVISGTEWGTASNWGNNIMPNANCNVTLSSNVTIGSAIDNTNIFQVFAKANSLTINAGNTLTVKSGAVLDVTSLTNNGTLAIEQGAILNVTGTLNNNGVMTTSDLNMAAINHLNIQPGAVVYVNGAVIGSTAANLTIMANATKMATLYLASASLVQPTATVQNYTVAKKVAETYTWQHYGIPTVSAPTMTAPASTYYYGWDNMNGWTKEGQSMVTTPFIGYNMTNEETAASTISFAGQLVGNDATTATLSRGWNFLANSYTTRVSTAAIINNLPAGAEQTICMYDPCYRGETNMSYVSAADVLDGTAGVATLLPMQTYFVEVKEGADAISMDYADIAINPTAPASAPARMNTPNYTGRVFINVESTMGSDVVKLRESADFSTAWDNGADASKMGKVVNSAPLLYVAAATRQAQLATDNLVGTVLGLEAGNTTDYTLTFSGLQGQTYILRDLATGVETEMTEDAQYHFSAEKGSVNAARFAIVGVRKVTTDMGEASVESHSTKVIENGQVVIVRDGVRYNVLGTETK